MFTAVLIVQTPAIIVMVFTTVYRDLQYVDNFFLNSHIKPFFLSFSLPVALFISISLSVPDSTEGCGR